MREAEVGRGEGESDQDGVGGSGPWRGVGGGGERLEMRFSQGVTEGWKDRCAETAVPGWLRRSK